MKNIIIFLLTASLLLNSKPVKIDYSGTIDTGLYISAQLSEYNISIKNTAQGTFSYIEFDEGVRTNKKGYAELPFFTKSVQIGKEKNVSLDYEVTEFEEIKLENPLLPSRGIITRSQDPTKIAYEISDRSIKDEWYAADPVKMTDPFISRAVRGVNIIFYPFQYNAYTGILRINKTFKVNLTENDKEPVNPLKHKYTSVKPEMVPLYNSLFLNFNDTKELEVGESGEMLVIYTSQNGGLNAIQPYIDWKKQKGFTVHSMEVPNGTDLYADSIVQNAYDSNPDLLYVQLVGDWGNLKSKFDYYSVTSSDGSQDPVLGHVAGRDKYQDVIIGRFSVNSEQELSDQIAKTINYEKNPDMNGEWYSKALGIASNEGAGIGDDGESDEEHNDIIINDKLVPNLYDRPSTAYQSSGAGSSNIASAVNSGLSLINYTGHGYYQSWSSVYFSNSNVSSLSNGSSLPVVISVACLVGHLSYGSDCFAESWMKNTNGGSVAGWFSTISQPWLPPMRGQDYFNDLLTGGYDYSVSPGNGTSTFEGRSTFGSQTVNAAQLTLAEAPLDGSTLATIETWTLFGDASLQVRTEQPLPIVNNNEVVFPELYSTSVTCSEGPVGGAQVTLYQNGENYTGFTDHEGNVSVPHSFVEGDVTVTVSGRNLETLQNILPVQSPEGPYLSVDSYSFSSSNYGDTSYLDINIKNIGREDCYPDSMILTTESEYINIIDGNYDIEEGSLLRPDSLILISNGFLFEIDPLTPDGERISFTVLMNDNNIQKYFSSKVYITVSSPAIEISEDILGTALQGEEQTVRFTLQNSGTAQADNITAEVIQTTDFNISISPPQNITVLEPDGSSEIDFVFYYGNNIPSSSFARFYLRISSDTGIYKEHEYEVVVGLTDGFESGDFSTYGWDLSGDEMWVIDNTVKYEGEFSANSGSVGNSQRSSMSADFKYISDGSISFYVKVSSESAYDKLTFYIDGSYKKSWSGERDWEYVSFSVPSGIVELKWEFSRDSSLGAGGNCAWVDNILATGIETGIFDTENSVSELKLYQNYPNPFNPETSITYFLPAGFKDNVRLVIYNSKGAVVNQLVDGIQKEGRHTVNFNASELPTGVYYYGLYAGGRKNFKKMLMLK